MARKVVLAGACRTAIGTMGGSLSGVPAPDLGTIVIKEALKRTGIQPDMVDEVYMGCVIQAGLGQNPARQAAVNAGIPVEVPATTINVLCGSGLHCVNLAAKLISMGDADIIVAGGMENMSKAPYLLYGGRYGYRMGSAQIDDAMIRDALTDAFGGYHMGITAENICDEWGLTREQLDEFAAWSQNKAEAAIAAGKFKDEIVPVEVKQKKKTFIFDTDEGPRPGAMATWIGGELAGCRPDIMGIGPVYATRKVMEKTGYTINDFDLIEANEAFAAQSVAVAHDLAWNNDILNVNGGAIALGHPVGASGCRILVTLLYEMQRRDAKKGLATLCVGGGMGCAAIVERD